jgi:hypothetical protein
LSDAPASTASRGEVRMQIVREPLVLISQISRSGGKFLQELFDDHPALWSHPHELHIGMPRKWDWPNIQGSAKAGDVYELLRERNIERFAKEGAFQKGAVRHPMRLDLAFQRDIFLELAEKFPPQWQREWIDLFFTAFFNAWNDYRQRGPKRFVMAFASMLALNESSVERFRADYPDGFLISIIREPIGWYSSVKQRTIDQPKKASIVYGGGVSPYRGFADAEKAYLVNVESIRRNRALFGDRFVLVDYTDLTRDTEKTMRRLAERIGIDFTPSMLEPTFNGLKVLPNTSFKSEGQRAVVLTEEDRSRIESGPAMKAYLSSREMPATA